MTAARTRLPRPERRATILEGAAAAFARGGFGATSMADIADAVGVSHLIVYRHFASKQELYEAVLARVVGGLDTALRADDAVGRYGPRASTVLGAARTDPAGFTTLFRHAAREPEFATWAERGRAVVLDATVRALRPIVAATDLRWAARATTTYLVDAVLVWIEEGDERRDDRFVAATDAAQRAGVTSWSRSSPRPSAGHGARH
ncbi:MAG: TetR/AcrR family transcriptional regulator [Acidimicrobiia bacterium]